MKIQLILALGALALCFALSGCVSGAKKSSTTDVSDPAAAKDMANHSSGDGDDADPESHRKTVLSRAEEFRKCYIPALKLNPKLRGAVTLSWDVDSAGDVVKEEVVATNTTIHDKVMIECMLEKVHSWKFDTGPKDMVSTVVYPFYFNPSID